jgi:hypothetical protein
VTRFALAIAVAVDVFVIVTSAAKAWLRTGEWFQAVVLSGFTIGATAVAVSSVVSGRFSSKSSTGKPVSRTRQPISFWVSYWFWICFPLAIAIAFLLN